MQNVQLRSGVCVCVHSTRILLCNIWCYCALHHCTWLVRLIQLHTQYLYRFRVTTGQEKQGKQGKWWKKFPAGKNQGIWKFEQNQGIWKFEENQGKISEFCNKIIDEKRLDRCENNAFWVWRSGRYFFEESLSGLEHRKITNSRSLFSSYSYIYFKTEKVNLFCSYYCNIIFKICKKKSKRFL